MPLPRGCKIREIDIGSGNCFQFQLDCPLFTFPEPYTSLGAGVIKACRNKVRGRVVYNVERLFVQDSIRRRGFATALYEKAAEEACRRRARLASMARQRGSNSYAFWLKQEQKGRANVYPQRVPKNSIDNTFDKGFWKQVSDVFVLKDCNRPVDLSGVSTRPAWIR